MNDSLYVGLCRDLGNKFRDHEVLSDHFESFCKAAQLLGTAETAIKGIKASREGRALLLEFLDRRIRITMRHDRAANNGVLYVEDISDGRPDDRPMRLTGMTFDSRSETKLSGGFHGDKLHLTVRQDAVALALYIVTIALNSDPWRLAEVPVLGAKPAR